MVCVPIFHVSLFFKLLPLVVFFLPGAGKGGWEGFYKIPPIPPSLKGGKGRG